MGTTDKIRAFYENTQDGEMFRVSDISKAIDHDVNATRGALKTLYNQGELDRKLVKEANCNHYVYGKPCITDLQKGFNRFLYNRSINHEIYN